MQESERLQQGKAMRAKVLGAEYATKTTRPTGDFEEPFQRIVGLEFSWGDIWNRPGLELKIRSICVVTILTILHLPNELALHIKGALNNGATKDEIREVMMQISAYAGGPTAKFGMEIAKKVIDEYYAQKH